MKKLLLFSALFIFACSADDSSEESPLPTYTIEGKWLIEGTVPAGNTMYLYEDGVRYTYYCVEDDCNALYNSYEANDGNHIPATNPYTFENNVLTVDLHFGSELVTPVAFECDGGEAYFETPKYSLFRLNSDCN
ncbi:MAG: hypothetical protein P8H23_00515 [Flavobacteriaceae bacterium]|nr:hypothetical protein [Flavobacteriaceae bacterium]